MGTKHSKNTTVHAVVFIVGCRVPGKIRNYDQLALHDIDLRGVSRYTGNLLSKGHRAQRYDALSPSRGTLNPRSARKGGARNAAAGKEERIVTRLKGEGPFLHVWLHVRSDWRHAQGAGFDRKLELLRHQARHESGENGED